MFFTNNLFIILRELRSKHSNVLPYFWVGAKDKKYQIWERNVLSIEIHSNETMFQKIKYIHQNPAKAKIVTEEIDYKIQQHYTTKKE